MKHSGKIFVSLCLAFIVITCSTDNKPTYTLTATVTPTEAGSVSPASGQYDEGTSVQITATPNQHWVFNRWQGDVTGTNNPVTVVMNSNKNLTALFVVRDYALTITIDGEGSVMEQVIQQRTTEYEYGTYVQLTAEAAEGWQFHEWSGVLSGNENPQTLMIDQPKQVTAHFTQIPDAPAVPMKFNEVIPVYFDLDYVNSFDIPDDEELAEPYANFAEARRWMNEQFFYKQMDSPDSDMYTPLDFAELGDPQYDGESWSWIAKLPSDLIAFKHIWPASESNVYEIMFVITATPISGGFEWIYRLVGKVNGELFVDVVQLSGQRSHDWIQGMWFAHEYDDILDPSEEWVFELYRWEIYSDEAYWYSQPYEYYEASTESEYVYEDGMHVEKDGSEYTFIIAPEKIHPDLPDLGLYVTVFWNEATRSGWYENSEGERFCFVDLINAECD